MELPDILLSGKRCKAEIAAASSLIYSLKSKTSKLYEYSLLSSASSYKIKIEMNHR